MYAVAGWSTTWDGNPGFDMWRNLHHPMAARGMLGPPVHSLQMEESFRWTAW